MIKIKLIIFFLLLGGSFSIFIRNNNINISIYFYLNILLFFFFNYVNIYIHEFGHVLFGVLTGIRTKKILIGNGREIYRIKILGCDLVITNNSRGGFDIPIKMDKKLIKVRYSAFVLGGVLAQSILVSICYLVFGFTTPRFITGTELNFSGAFIVANIYTILISVIPLTINFRGLRIPNDGLMLLKLLINGKKGVEELLASGMLNEGHIYYEDKEFEKAANIFAACMQSHSDNPLAKINMSAALSKLVKVDEAIDILQQLEQEKYDKKYEFLVLNNLAWLMLLKNNTESLKKADELSERALKLNSKIMFVQGTRGCILIEKGKIDAGIKYLSQCTNLKKPVDPQTNRPVNFLYMAYGLYENGKIEECGKYLRHLEAYRQSLDPDELYLLNRVKKRTNNFDNYFSDNLVIAQVDVEERKIKGNEEKYLLSKAKGSARTDGEY
jgi:tetratricopeptide (TPR) repeat protein